MKDEAPPLAQRDELVEELRDQLTALLARLRPRVALIEVGSAAAVAAAVLVPALGWYDGRRAAATAGARPVAAFRAVMVVALIDVVLLVASGRVV